MRLQCTLCLYTAVFAVTVTAWLAMYMYSSQNIMLLSDNVPSISLSKMISSL